MRKRIIAMMFISSLVFVAIIAYGVESSAKNDTKELQLLHVIVRHGARTPADTYPNDPYINETFYPFGWGQLTNDGKLNLYNLGQWLRLRYNQFLGNHYSPDEFYAQSTDVDRTKASIQTINAGLWPPDVKWGPINWQPIPVHSEPLSQDSLLLVRKPCPQYHLELKRVMQTETIQKLLKEYQNLFENLTKITGKAVENFDDVQDIYSTLKAEESYNLTIPEFIKPYYPDLMTQPTIFSYVLNAYNDKLKRLKGGVLLKKLIFDWRNKIDGSLKFKAFLYGGHDSTVVNILRTLNVWDPQMPNYGITILLEFSKDRITQTYGLEIFLRNSTKVEPYQLKIPGCDAFCRFDDLIALTSNVIPGDWDEECKTDDPNYIPPTIGGP